MPLAYQAFSTGQIQFQRDLSAVVDGMPLSGSQHFVLTPIDDVSDQPEDVQAVCTLWWTDEHRAAWQALLDAQAAA